MSQIHLETLDAILEKHQCDPSQVIAIMQDIQKEYHYLPESALCYTPRSMVLPPSTKTSPLSQRENM